MPETTVLASRVAGAQAELPSHHRIPNLTINGVLKVEHAGVHGIDSQISASDALKVLADQGIGAIPVLDGEQIVGIFSLQDFARATALLGQSAAIVSVSRVMTPCCCHVLPDDSVQTALHRMHENHLQHIPVKEAGHTIALLSREDLLSAVVLHYERVFRELALDQQILFLRGTYSC